MTALLLIIIAVTLSDIARTQRRSSRGQATPAWNWFWTDIHLAWKYRPDRKKP